jgi:hypothetical protein
LALGLIVRDGVVVLIGIGVAAIATAIAIAVGGGILAGIYFAARAVLGF